MLFDQIGTDPRAVGAYQKDAQIVLAYQTAFEEAERSLGAAASALTPALKSTLEQTLQDHTIIIKTAGDVEKARQKLEPLKTFKDQLEQGKGFQSALAAIDAEWPPASSDGLEKSAVGISAARSAAFNSGTTEPGKLPEATRQLVELLVMVKACKSYAAVFQRIKEPCKKATASAPSFGPRYEAAIRPVAQAVAPTSGLFAEQQKLLEALELMLPHVGNYAAASAAVSKEYAAIRKMSPPAGPEEKRVATVNGQLEKSIAAAEVLTASMMKPRPRCRRFRKRLPPNARRALRR